MNERDSHNLSYVAISGFNGSRDYARTLLQGARDAREWTLLIDYLASRIWVGVADVRDSHVAAARIYFDCRRKGLAIRSSMDCMIAQILIEHDGVLLHDDRDFASISKVTALRCLPI